MRRVHGLLHRHDGIHEQPERLVYVQCGACQSELEVELAEKIVYHVPSTGRVRFYLSGSETVQMTFRLARALTNKSKFVSVALTEADLDETICRAAKALSRL